MEVHGPHALNLSSSHTAKVQAAYKNSLSWLQKFSFKTLFYQGARCLNFIEVEQQTGKARFWLDWEGERNTRSSSAVKYFVTCSQAVWTLFLAGGQSQPGASYTSWPGLERGPKWRLSWNLPEPCRSSAEGLVVLAPIGAQKEGSPKRNMVCHTGCVSEEPGQDR